MSAKNVWVIVPAFNEGPRIIGVIKGIRKHSKNIVVVDDGSKDNTYRIISKENVHYIRNIINIGKGAALKTGCDYAINNGAEIIIALDGDGQHDPAEIPNFLHEIEKGKKIVFGYREGRKSMPLILRYGNWFINKVTRLLYGVKLKDTQSGYRAFTASAYNKIRWKSADYSMESEMIANLGKHKMKYGEIPIKMIYYDTYKGTTIKDGVKIVINMIIWRFFK